MSDRAKPSVRIRLTVDIAREPEGRWRVKVQEFPGEHHGETPSEALLKAFEKVLEGMLRGMERAEKSRQWRQGDGESEA